MKCVICKQELDYEPDYCCIDNHCACQGLPIDPPVCSNRCYEKLMDEYNKAFDEAKNIKYPPASPPVLE